MVPTPDFEWVTSCDNLCDWTWAHLSLHALKNVFLLVSLPLGANRQARAFWIPPWQAVFIGCCLCSSRLMVNELWQFMLRQGYPSGEHAAPREPLGAGGRQHNACGRPPPGIARRKGRPRGAFVDAVIFFPQSPLSKFRHGGSRGLCPESL